MISYQSLYNLYQNSEPYKGSDDIPYDKRSHRHKFFNVKVVDGKMEFHLSYYWKWYEETMDLTDYQIIEPFLSKFQKERWSQISMDYCDYKIPYMRRWRKLSEPFCIVRDDNTMEFITENTHQGLRMIISDHLKYGHYMMKEKASGGVVIRSSFRANSGLKIPVFKGLRLYMDTLEVHESSKYKLELLSVDRKQANMIHKNNQDRYRLTKAFYHSMEKEDLAEGITEVVQEYFDNDFSWSDQEKAKHLAHECWETDPVKASYLYLLGYSILDARWLPKHTAGHLPIAYYNKVKHAIKHNSIVTNKAFAKQNYWDFDKNYPTSRWGMNIIKVSDGSVVKQAQ